MSMIVACVAPLLLAFGGGDEASGRAAPRAKAPERSVKATEALAGASKLKREASQAKGEEKLEALVRAAKGYERVARDLADERAASAEASFRAGEIWRTIRHEEEARRCFQETAGEIAGAPGFAARAWIELGHLERRQHRLDEARRCYERVLSIVPEQRRECARALTWQGKTLIEQKNAKDGHVALLAVGARYPEFPLDDIRNVDLVAVDWIKSGRIEEARQLVNDCIERHSEDDDADADDSAKDDKDDRDEPVIRRALDKMKSRDLLSNPPAASGRK
jgi:tetratricopeptide (TPR) repeat protein